MVNSQLLLFVLGESVQNEDTVDKESEPVWKEPGLSKILRKGLSHSVKAGENRDSTRLHPKTVMFFWHHIFKPWRTTMVDLQPGQIGQTIQKLTGYSNHQHPEREFFFLWLGIIIMHSRQVFILCRSMTVRSLYTPWILHELGFPPWALFQHLHQFCALFSFSSVIVAYTLSVPEMQPVVYVVYNSICVWAVLSICSKYWDWWQRLVRTAKHSLLWFFLSWRIQRLVNVDLTFIT